MPLTEVRRGKAVRWSGAAALVLLSSAIFFRHLGTPSLLGDESTHAEVARESATAGRWWPLTYHGSVYIAKPPLTIWATAAVFRTLGVSERNDRLLDATLGVAIVLLVYGWAAAVFGIRAGLLAGLFLLSTNYFIFLHGVRAGVPDTVLVFLVSAALLLHFLARDGSKFPFGSAIACGVLTGLAILTKNAVGWFVPLVIVTFEVVRALPTRPAKLTLRRIAVIVLIALAFQIAWFIAVSRATGGGASFFFLRDVWERFRVGLDPGHRNPGLYEFILKFDFGKGLLLLPPAVVFAVRDARSGRKARAEAVLFLFCWATAVVFVMEPSVSKLPWYIYPAYPAIVLILGFAIDRVVTTTDRFPVFAAAFVLIVAFFIGTHLRRAWITADRDILKTDAARIAEWVSAPDRPVLCREQGLQMRDWEEYYLRPLAKPQGEASGCGLLLTRNPAAHLPPQEISSRAHAFRRYSPLDPPLYVVSIRGDLPTALR